jgi:hypothetical protein
VLVSRTVLAFLQFFAMRTELGLSARGLMRHARRAQEFVAKRGKSSKRKKEK